MNRTRLFIDHLAASCLLIAVTALAVAAFIFDDQTIINARQFWLGF